MCWSSQQQGKNKNKHIKKFISQIPAEFKNTNKKYTLSIQLNKYKSIRNNQNKHLWLNFQNLICHVLHNFTKIL